MRIERLAAAMFPAYEDFLANRETALLYQSPRFLSLVCDLLRAEQRTIVATDGDSGIVGALPLLAIDGPYGKVLNSLPFYGSNGGIMAQHELAAAALVSAYNQIVAEPGVAASTLVTNPLDEVDYSSLKFDLTDERIGQFTSLRFADHHAEHLMASFHHKTRNMIRKAERLQVTVSPEIEMLDYVEDIHRENMLQIGGLAKPHRFFDLIPTYFRPALDYKVYVGRLDSEPVAALLVFYFNRTVEYFTPVVMEKYRETQALSAVIFKAMCDASRDGYHWWNWGGTWKSQEGVYRFKKRWGTQDKPYHYLVRLLNKQLFELEGATVLRTYPFFYVLPFSALAPPREET